MSLVWRKGAPMKYEYMHPREQIVTIMRRVYGYGMTTTCCRRALEAIEEKFGLV